LADLDFETTLFWSCLNFLGRSCYYFYVPSYRGSFSFELTAHSLYLAMQGKWVGLLSEYGTRNELLPASLDIDKNFIQVKVTNHVVCSFEISMLACIYILSL